jgi:ABC-2 type transport system ATP-binding protein
MLAAIETHHLTKRFGAVLAVDDVSLRVARGEIYAFLGLNGAGKTTTIRALLGMITPTAGRVTVLGEQIRLGGRGPWRRVGHLVETPSAYPELTVHENLEIARRLQGVTDRAATTRAIDLFQLGAYAHRRAGTLSLGNLQRLGLARALLHEPELVILDEPANGLDPAGVVEIRALLAALAHERGVTVFVSSHVLAEVDRLATRIGIIHHGRLIQELTHSELEQQRARWLVVGARDPDAACAALQADGYAVTRSDPTSLLIVDDPHAVAAPDDIARRLVMAGLSLTRLAVEQEDLEQYFLRLTGARP